MKQPDTLKCLGVYASGTLSPAEERKLYEAALDDQELFNAVADEELLREALADQAFRQRLIRRLREMDREPASGISAVITNWFFGTSLGISRSILLLARAWNARRQVAWLLR